MPPALRTHCVAPVLAAAALSAVAAACARDDADARPPAAEFLIASGDSTYWVAAGPGGVRLRRSPLALTRYNGRFYEVYVADDDRSYYDAVFVGQRVYRRDLLTGDSAAVFADTTVRALARRYGVRHPDAEPLTAEEEGMENPHTVATGEVDILDAHGPYLSYEYRADVDVDEEPEVHTTRRGVVDLRSGRPATLRGMFGDDGAALAVARGRRAYHDALDSIRASHDRRAARAAAALESFTFDERSYALTETGDRDPAVAFLVPGSGQRAAGLVLSLPPVPVPAPRWWGEVREALPERLDSVAGATRILGLAAGGAADRPNPVGDRWRRGTYDVLAAYDSTGESLLLALRDTAGHRWPIGRLAAPAHYVFWLDRGVTDSAARRGLTRAFDESALYSEDARTAGRERARGSARPPPLRTASWRSPTPSPARRAAHPVRRPLRHGAAGRG
jgi:hypothetical protein